MAIKITGTGCYIPENITSNRDFLKHEFFQADGSLFTIANEAIIEKFQSITGISERKYAKNHHTASDQEACHRAEPDLRSASLRGPLNSVPALKRGGRRARDAKAAERYVRTGTWEPAPSRGGGAPAERPTPLATR